jgi:hypothetical protein
MLTQCDIEMMKQDVRGIVMDWGTYAIVLQPKPEAEQTNWNPVLREYTGKMECYAMVVYCERKDTVGAINSGVEANVAGDKITGSFVYSIPDIDVNGETITIDSDSIFILDDSDNRFMVKSIKDRIGEQIIQLTKYTGGSPAGNGYTEGIGLWDDFAKNGTNGVICTSYGLIDRRRRIDV